MPRRMPAANSRTNSPAVADSDVQTHLDHFIDSHEALQITVFDANQSVIATTSSDPQLLTPAFPDSATLLQVRNGGRYAAAEPIGSRLILRIVLPLERRAPGGQHLLQALYPVPNAIQPLTSGIEQASFDFQRLKYLRGSLKLTFNIVLTFVLLLSALFARGRRIRHRAARDGADRPPRHGDESGRRRTLRHAAAGRGDDELGFLLTSFDQMQRELELASSRVSHQREETENQRAYLKAVLERLSAGVLGLDRDRRAAHRQSRGRTHSSMRRCRVSSASISSVVRQQYPELGAADRSGAQARARRRARMARRSRDRRAANASRSCCAAPNSGRCRGRNRCRRRHRRSDLAQPRAARCGVGRSRAPSRA